MLHLKYKQNLIKIPIFHFKGGIIREFAAPRIYRENGRFQIHQLFWKEENVKKIKS